MFTNRETIERVQQRYSKGVQSDDSRLSNRLVYAELCTNRSLIIAQQSNKNQIVSAFTYQELIGISMIEAPIHDLAGVPAGIVVLKSEERIPNILTNMDKHLIEYVTTLDGSVEYSEISWNGIPSIRGNKYTANKPRYFFKSNGHLYITTSKVPEVVTMRALFENPLEVQRFKSFGECNVSCDSNLDFPFPMDNDKMNTIIEMTADSLIQKYFNRQRQDTKNNAQDDTTP